MYTAWHLLNEIFLWLEFRGWSDIEIICPNLICSSHFRSYSILPRKQLCKMTKEAVLVLLCLVRQNGSIRFQSQKYNQPWKRLPEASCRKHACRFCGEGGVVPHGTKVTPCTRASVGTHKTVEHCNKHDQRRDGSRT